jgi:hypothetical protein
MRVYEKLFIGREFGAVVGLEEYVEYKAIAA